MREIIVLFMLFYGIAGAQEKSVSLKSCYENMLNSYPLTLQNEVYEQTSQLQMQNIKSGWLPGADLSMQAAYQSDAIKVDVQVMGNSFGFEGDKDQYKATVNVNQLIYDWGRIKSAKQLESVNLKVNKQSTVVELNKLKEQVNSFYFAILILESNEKVLDAMLLELAKKEETVEAGVKNGILLSSDLSAIKAEKIKLKQAVAEIANQRQAAISALAELTGSEFSPGTLFTIPEYEIDDTTELARPELLLFDYKAENLEAKSKLVSKQNKPVLFAFSQLGYGKPGLNMVSDEFDSFYYVGVGLNWELWDWNKTKREKEMLLINKGLVSAQQQSFTKQIHVALQNEKANINNYKQAIESDVEIIKMREEITENVKSKLDNGVITSTDFITELTKETQAKLSYETHKIKLVQSKVNYLYLRGEL